MPSADSVAPPHSQRLALDVATQALEMLQLRLLKVIMQASKGLEKKAVKLLSLEASAQAKASQAEARLEAKAAAKRKRQEEKQAEKAQLKRCFDVHSPSHFDKDSTRCAWAKLAGGEYRIECCVCQTMVNNQILCS